MPVEMPPRPYDTVSMSNHHQPTIMDPQYQQQQQQPYGAAAAATTQGYAYYAAPQYNFNYGTNVNNNNNNNNATMNPQFLPPPSMHSWPQPPQSLQQQPYGGGAPLTTTVSPMAHAMDRGTPAMPSLSTTTSINYVMERILEPHDNDVLMGRGGKNNQHAGNERLRDMARAVRDRYKASAKKGKSNMSRDLVQAVRDLVPPGRFLKRNPVTNEWEDVGDEIAREKVSQVLRDAVSEWVGPKAAAAAAAAAAAKDSPKEDHDNPKDNEQDDDDNEKDKQDKKEDLPPANKKETSETTTKTSLPLPEAEIPKAQPPVSSSASSPSPIPQKPKETVTPPTPKPSTPVSTVAASPDISDVADSIDNDSIVDDDLPNNNNNGSGSGFPVMNDDSLNDAMAMISGGGGVGSTAILRERIMSDMSFQDPALDEPRARLESNDDFLLSVDTDESLRGSTTDFDDDIDDFDDQLDDDETQETEPKTNTASSQVQINHATTRRRSSLKVPVSAVPWNRNKRKTNLLDRYSNMNMGLSSSDMSITSTASQLSSRNLGAQLSSRQLISTGARQMSSRQLSNRQLSSKQLSSRQMSTRQLSSRQLSNRQLSSRQLSSRQLSGRQLMSADRRRQSFAFMGESDLSLDALSISGDSFMKPLSRKNIFMDQYMAMDMGLSDFSLGSMAGEPLGCDTNGHAGYNNNNNIHRVSVIVEGDLEDMSEHGSSSHLLKLSKHGSINGGSAHKNFAETYSAYGIGTSISNMTINTIGTFSGHSRRGVFANTGNSMRMESGHTFLTMDDLQLEMLDDELFDEFAELDGADEFGIMEEEDEDDDSEFGDEFASEFC